MPSKQDRNPRVTGVNVLNDQGEGRFIAICGLSPDLNAVSVDDIRLPAPESDVRAVVLMSRRSTPSNRS